MYGITEKLPEHDRDRQGKGTQVIGMAEGRDELVPGVGVRRLMQVIAQRRQDAQADQEAPADPVPARTRNGMCQSRAPM